MKKSSLVFLAFLFFCPILVNAQSYYLPYYEQRSLSKTRTHPYFLENRTGSPLMVTLLIKLPTGEKKYWFFDIEQDSEVYTKFPSVGVRASVSYAVASVPKGNKIVLKKVKSFVYDRERVYDVHIAEAEGVALRGWVFYR